MKGLVLIYYSFFCICNAIAQTNDKKSYTVEDILREGWIARPEDSSPPPVKQKAKLGMIDKWRYEMCQQDAGSAPTAQGVILKKRVCDEKFDQ